MVKIPPHNDPTLDAIDSAIESRENAIPQRSYLGMSQLGDDCSRKLWYSFRHAKAKDKKAKLIKAAEDGYAGEELMATRLRMVDGIVLETVDPNNEDYWNISIAQNMAYMGKQTMQTKEIRCFPEGKREAW